MDNEQPQPITSEPVETQTDPIVIAPDPVAPAKKKPKALVIIAAIVGVLLIAGGVFAVLWFVNYTKPEKVALDAMNKLFKAPVVKAEGDVSIMFPKQPYGITSIELKLEAGSSIIPTYSKGNLTFSAGEDKFSLDINAAILSDGIIYFQTSGLTEVVEKPIPTSLKVIVDQVTAEISNLDRQWLKFDLVETLALFDVNVSSSEYDCLISGIKTLNSDAARASFVDGYTKFPFVLLEKNNNTLNDGVGYIASIESPRLANFASYLLNETKTLNAFKSCEALPTAKDAHNAFTNLDLPSVTLFISDWGHELKAISLAYTNDSITVGGGLSLSYPAAIETETPTSAKPFSAFLETILPKIKDQLKGVQ